MRQEDAIGTIDPANRARLLWKLKEINIQEGVLNLTRAFNEVTVSSKAIEKVLNEFHERMIVKKGASTTDLQIAFVQWVFDFLSAAVGCFFEESDNALYLPSWFQSVLEETASVKFNDLLEERKKILATLSFSAYCQSPGYFITELVNEENNKERMELLSGLVRYIHRIQQVNSFDEVESIFNLFLKNESPQVFDQFYEQYVEWMDTDPVVKNFSASDLEEGCMSIVSHIREAIISLKRNGMWHAVLEIDAVLNTTLASLRAGVYNNFIGAREVLICLLPVINQYDDEEIFSKILEIAYTQKWVTAAGYSYTRMLNVSGLEKNVVLCDLHFDNETCLILVKDQDKKLEPFVSMVEDCKNAGYKNYQKYCFIKLARATLWEPIEREKSAQKKEIERLLSLSDEGTISQRSQYFFRAIQYIVFLRREKKQLLFGINDKALYFLINQALQAAALHDTEANHLCQKAYANGVAPIKAIETSLLQDIDLSNSYKLYMARADLMDWVGQLVNDAEKNKIRELLYSGDKGSGDESIRKTARNLLTAIRYFICLLDSQKIRLPFELNTTKLSLLIIRAFQAVVPYYPEVEKDELYQLYTVREDLRKRLPNYLCQNEAKDKMTVFLTSGETGTEIASRLFGAIEYLIHLWDIESSEILFGPGGVKLAGLIIRAIQAAAFYDSVSAEKYEPRNLKADFLRKIDQLEKSPERETMQTLLNLVGTEKESMRNFVMAARYCKNLTAYPGTLFKLQKAGIEPNEISRAQQVAELYLLSICPELGQESGSTPSGDMSIDTLSA
ncbi:MAG: hypothetical protein A3F41_01110 [Coxiella sp. RIFCSPHIGHO2_12_FULL_44_14]|nr:MAG: hypothetical protein A3F41_01110 [Coxiella sp. RIFCSPHIGHO2_12_FULL_44_14]